jgi:hypothetical protein
MRSATFGILRNVVTFADGTDRFPETSVRNYCLTLENGTDRFLETSVRNYCLTLEGGTDRFSRNVGEKLLLDPRRWDR